MTTNPGPEAEKPMDLAELTTAIAKSAGAIHDRVVETGTLAMFPKARDAGHYVARLAELGVITAQDVDNLNSLVCEVQNAEAPDALARITGSGNRILSLSDASPVATAIAGIAVASAAKAAKSVVFSFWGTVGSDVLGGLIGGVAGGIAGSMEGGRVGAYAGAGFGAVVVGGLASSE